VSARRRPSVRGTCLGLAALAACAAPGPTLDSLDRTLRASGLRTVVLREDFALYSPYDADGTRPFVALVEEELAMARAILGVEPVPPIPVWLRPVPRDGEDSELVRVFPGQGDQRGATSSVGEVYVWVDGDPARAHVQVALLPRSVVRHELAHALLRRGGITLPRWLNESLCTALQDVRRGDDGSLRDDPLPEALLEARALADRASLADVLAWRPPDAGVRPDADPATALYALGGSFLLFQCERLGRDPLAAALVLAARDERALLADEDVWRAWLQGLDLEARMRALLALGGPAPLARALDVTGLLGPEALGGAMDAAAGDVALARADVPAVLFLLRRAPWLDAASLRRLESAASPFPRALALAVRKRRGEPVDPAHARALWDELDEGAASLVGPVRDVLLGPGSR
jgi:hypothetical protein